MSLQGRSIVACFAAVAGVALIAGCGINPELAAPAPLSVQPPPAHIQVKLVSFDHDLYFARGAKALTSAQAAALNHFLKVNEIGEGDSVTVDVSGTSTLATARKAAVVSELKQLGIDAASGKDARLAADSVRVHADHAVATAPACPNWSKPEADEPDNTTSSNLGCATEANLAAMIVNPADLVKPKATATTDGAALAHGVELYRAGKLSKTIGANSGYSTSGISGGTGGSGSGGGGGTGGGGQ
jgi:pilus assembly protein CpaD